MNTLKETRPVANKEHTCNWCGGKIVKGEKYNRQTILFDGRIYDWVSHLDCLELTGLLDMFDYDYGDGINDEKGLCDLDNDGGKSFCEVSIDDLCFSCDKADENQQKQA